MSIPVIEVIDLSFEYPGFRALDQVSLSIKAGTVTALVGPNGAGKTTLLRCIAALETPLCGLVRVAGLDVHESPRDAHRMMGYLSDNFGLYGDLSVAQGLEYAACSQGLTPNAVAQAVQTTAMRLDLGDKLQSIASTLSRGQRQRLAIGQAIIHSPKVLLLDEPASGLDPEARSTLAQVFKTLQLQGMSLLVSSHILAELDEYCTHMLALDQGRVLEHRALQHSTQDAPDDKQVRRLRLEFAAPTVNVAPWLSGYTGVQVLTTEASRIDIELTGNAANQADLVAACVRAGHPLCTVAPVTENLQQSYIKSLEAGRKLTNPPRTTE